MSYTVLYREFRPKNFSDIIGQDTIINILKNEIKNNQISHAYLFTGIRGTGKTSTAKVFARAICCLNNKDGEACGECASCKNVDGADSDIIEIDAASNRGIDEIRDLKQKVSYMPTFGKYKVYIIDEVHMLTTEAFNALLKTLEDPPSHVVFIFATTEPGKILPTILSRCQRFDFGRIDTDVIINHMAEILKEKNIEYEEEALRTIALTSEGALRDALSLLDKAISISDNGKVSAEIIEEVLGLINEDDIYTFAEAILDSDVDTSLFTLDALLARGKEIDIIIKQLMEFYRDKIVAVSVKNPEQIINKNKEYIEHLKSSYNDHESLAKINEMLSSLAKLKNDMRFFSEPRYLLEAKLISFCSISAPISSHNTSNKSTATNTSSADISLLNDRIISLEKELKELEKKQAENFSRPSIIIEEEIYEIKSDEESNQIEIDSQNAKEKDHIYKDGEEVKVNFEEVRDITDILKRCGTYIANRYRENLIAEIVQNFKTVSFKDNILILYPGSYLPIFDTFKDFGGKELLRKTLKEQTGKDIKIKYIEKNIKLSYDKKGKKTLAEKAKEIINNDKLPEKKEAAQTETNTEPDNYLDSFEEMLPADEAGDMSASIDDDFAEITDDDLEGFTELSNEDVLSLEKSQQEDYNNSINEKFGEQE